MSRLLSLLFVLLLAFDVSLVAARPRSFYRHSLSRVDVSGLNTNAKRLARGLPPLPPLLKRKPTGVDTARRAANSQCSKSGVIQVTNLDTNVVLGYVSKNLLSDHYTLTDLSNAGTFSSSVDISGQTDTINLRVDDGTHFLAGLIKKNQALGDTDNKAAVLGKSLATNPGDSPQSNKDAGPSMNDRASETAIWSYNHDDHSLSAIWFNYLTDLPYSTLAFISYLVKDNKFDLTNSRTPPRDGIKVTFKYISVNDHCSA